MRRTRRSAGMYAQVSSSLPCDVVAVEQEHGAAQIERRLHVEELRPLDVGALLELRGRGQEIGAVAEVGPAVLALGDAPDFLAVVPHVAEAPVRQVQTGAALPAVVDVPGELERELRIVRRQVALVAGRVLRPFRVRERLTGGVVVRSRLRVELRLAGVVDRRLHVRRVRRVLPGIDDLHVEVGVVLDHVRYQLVGDDPRGGALFAAVIVVPAATSALARAPSARADSATADIQRFRRIDVPPKSVAPRPEPPLPPKHVPEDDAR